MKFLKLAIWFFTVVCGKFYLTGIGAVRPDCECVFYNGTFGRDYGIFQSPDFPAPYDPNIHCILYVFTAEEGHIVELNFHHVDLQNTTANCLDGDYVKLYLHLDRPGVNEGTPWNYVLCGRGPRGRNSGDMVVSPSNPLTYFSAKNTLIFQFRSDWIYGVNSGFNGTYRFIPDKQFQTDGTLMSSTLCDYSFLYPEDLDTRGSFFSPYYPSFYPKPVTCVYSFKSSDNCRILITLNEVSLTSDSDEPCLHSADTVVIRDGLSPDSQVIGTICGTSRGQTQFLSTGPELVVIFSASAQLSSSAVRRIPPSSSSPSASALISSSSSSLSSFYGQRNTGEEPVRWGFDLQDPQQHVHSARQNDKKFLAPLQPISSSPSSTVTSSSLSSVLGRGFNATYRFVRRSLKPRFYLEDSEGGSCNYIFSSDEGREGIIASKNYPYPYPPDSSCRFEFRGKGRERIQIVFHDFDLHSRQQPSLMGGNPSNEDLLVGRHGSVGGRCSSGEDTVRLYGEDVHPLKEYCGYGVPASFLSPDSNLLLKFVATSASTSGRFFKGFNATFRFVSDFAMKYGEIDKRFPCGFVFNSTNRVTGEFASPNFPGLYPRRTECHYFFYGLPFQEVHLSFEAFNVPGELPCDQNATNDYIVVSNSMDVDSIYRRYCGNRIPQSVVSEANFFRLTFVTGDANNGTGFSGRYVFREREVYMSDELNSAPRTMMGSTGNGATFLRLFTILATFLAWRIVTITPATTSAFSRNGRGSCSQQL